MNRAQIRASMGLGDEGRPRGIHWDRNHPHERVFPSDMTDGEAVTCMAARVEEHGDEVALADLQQAARTNPTAAALLPRALDQIRTIRAMRQGGR